MTWCGKVILSEAKYHYTFVPYGTLSFSFDRRTGNRRNSRVSITQANSIVNSMREKVPRRNAKWGVRSPTTLTNGNVRVRLQFVRFDIAAVPCSAFDNVTVIILWLNFTTQETERQSESWDGTDRDVGLRNSCSISFTRAGFSTVAVRKFLGDGTRRRVAIRIPSVSRCNWVNAG